MKKLILLSIILISCNSNDLDGDGILNDVDNCPNKANADQKDTDGDGVGDVCDDSDGDGIFDDTDNCVNTINTDQSDIDKDGKGDVCDDDMDGDGILNDDDNCKKVANADQADMDVDGIGNVCDDDKDGDTILNVNDNCPSIVNTDQADFDGDGIGDACDPDIDGDGVANDLDTCPNTSSYDLIDWDINPNGCSAKQIKTKAFAHLIKNKINEFQSPDEKPLTFDEIISRISVSESYGDYLYSFSYKKKSSPYLYRMYYYPEYQLALKNKNRIEGLEDLIKEVYLNEKLIREEVGNTIYTYDSSGNVEEKAYYKNGNLAELFNNDEVFELKLNSGKILKNRKTTETFFDENGNLASKFEFFQGVNYVFYQVCKCCPSFENYTSRSKRRTIDAIMFDWERSDCAEGGPAPVTPVVSTKTAIFYSNGLPKSKEVSLYKSVKNMDNLDEVSYLKEEKLPGYWDWEDIDFTFGGAYFSDRPNWGKILYVLSTGVSLTVDYNQNQEKSYSVTSSWEKIGLSEIYFVNTKSGLNVRDKNALDGNKIGGLPYGSLVYIAKENQGELTVNDTDPITGEKTQIEGNWVTVVSMDFKQTFFNENVIGGYAFDGFLTKVKTDSFDYFKFLETENRVHYSELEEGEVYLYKGEKYTGLAISFYDNGQLAFAASYKDGKLNGWWRKWEENGSLFLETEYVDGEMVSEMDFN